jgi:hypothetical protein
MMVGHALYRSDVQTMSDRPISDGTIVVVPAAAVADFWLALGYPSTGPAQPRRVEFAVTEAVLALPIEAARIDAGRFTSRLGAPSALLCLAPDSPADLGPPYRVVGCDAVPAGAPAPEVTVEVGRAGVTVLT